MMLVKFITSYEEIVCYIDHEEDDSIIQSICKTVQIELSLFSYNREYYHLISPSDHNFGLDDCHSPIIFSPTYLMIVFLHPLTFTIHHLPIQMLAKQLRHFNPH